MRRKGPTEAAPEEAAATEAEQAEPAAEEARGFSRSDPGMVIGLFLTRVFTWLSVT